jgi:multicomponent K+:H+ antiporter subunit D
VNHLAILPVLIPLLGAIASLFAEHRRFGAGVRRAVSWTAVAGVLIVALALFAQAGEGRVLVYLLGDWPSRLGIALMVDRLSAWMLLTTALLSIPCLLYACAGWDRRAPHFHALFQFQLMGLNGAFLTGDIFNLFVFFEVMLIASYGLLVSAGRGVRMRVGLHYVVFNVAASTLFLIALGLLYGLLGSLNVAELSERIARLPAADVPLARATLGLLLLVFCSKAALMPLYLWLPETYFRAPAAVAALFVIMTKVGLYAVLRVQSLWFEAPGPLQGFGHATLLWTGIATLVLAGLGVMAATRLRVLVAYLVVFSAATLFVAFSLDDTGAVAAGLYYLPHSTFAAAALFLIADLVRRRRGDASDRKEITAALPGRALPGTLYFIAAIAMAGLPPLSGFLAKAALLAHVPDAQLPAVWAAVLGGGLLVIIGLCRAGIRLFWRTPELEMEAEPSPRPRRARLHPAETAAPMILLGYVLVMSIAAAPLMRYADAGARQLRQPADYVEQLRDTHPRTRQP